jgi:hypothetical protein
MGVEVPLHSLGETSGAEPILFQWMEHSLLSCEGSAAYHEIGRPQPVAWLWAVVARNYRMTTVLMFVNSRIPNIPSSRP